MLTQDIPYRDGAASLRGFLACDETARDRGPGVLVVHEGLALATLAALPQVDAGRLGAIGFCFGGSVVLELARDGADLKAVVSFHGVLTTKAPAVAGKTRAGVLVCTGADDPLAPGLAGDQLWRHAARLHQSGSGRLHPAERPLQRESGPPIMAGDAELPCRGVHLNTDQDSDGVGGRIRSMAAIQISRAASTDRP